MEGHITYHRTDSHDAEREGAQRIGARRFATCSAASTTTARAAIRPRSRTRRKRTRRSGRPNSGWRRRGSASTLESDELRALRADLEAHDGVADGGRARAADDASKSPRDRATASRPCSPRSGKAIEFAGFRRAYVEGSDDPQAELEEQETILPACRVGDQVYAQGVMPAGREGLAYLGIEPKKHETLPPARYTEAALIKELERPASAGRRPTRRSSPPSRAAATCSARARRWCRRFTAFAVTRAAAPALHRLRRRRVHRGDGRSARRDQQRRARLARLRPHVLSRRRQASSGSTS